MLGNKMQIIMQQYMGVITQKYIQSIDQFGVSTQCQQWIEGKTDLFLLLIVTFNQFGQKVKAIFIFRIFNIICLALKFNLWFIFEISIITSTGSMDQWKIELKVEECTGIYTLLLRLGNTFSTPSLPANIVSNKLRFETTLTIECSMTVVELSFTHLQIMMVMTSLESNEGVSKDQQIIGIATIQVSYPLPKQLTSMRIYSFDKSFDLQGKIQAQLFITKSIEDLKQKGAFRKSSLDSKAVRVNFERQKQLKNITAELLTLQQQQNNEYKQYVKFIQKQLSRVTPVEESGQSRDEDKSNYETLLSQKNELFKLSEDLYEELKKCTQEKDDYLRELREKILSEEELQKQIDMLNFKVEAYQINSKSARDARATDLQEQLQQKQAENHSLMNQNEGKERKIKQLERKVTQCLKAIDQFRNQAIMAQTELIHKASELSIISRYSSNSHTEPYECISDLFKQLQSRRHFELDLNSSKYNANIPDIIAFLEDIGKDITRLFTRLLTQVKTSKQKEWLLSEKIQFQRRVEKKLSSFIDLAQ